MWCVCMCMHTCACVFMEYVLSEWGGGACACVVEYV